MTKPTELLTFKQVVHAMGCAPNTLRRWVERGAFPAPAMILGRNRWRKEDVDNYVDKAFKRARTPRVGA